MADRRHDDPERYPGWSGGVASEHDLSDGSTEDPYRFGGSGGDPYRFDDRSGGGWDAAPAWDDDQPVAWNAAGDDPASTHPMSSVRSYDIPAPPVAGSPAADQGAHPSTYDETAWPSGGGYDYPGHETQHWGHETHEGSTSWASEGWQSAPPGDGGWEGRPDDRAWGGSWEQGGDRWEGSPESGQAWESGGDNGAWQGAGEGHDAQAWAATPEGAADPWAVPAAGSGEGAWGGSWEQGGDRWEGSSESGQAWESGSDNGAWQAGDRQDQTAAWPTTAGYEAETQPARDDAWDPWGTAESSRPATGRAAAESPDPMWGAATPGDDQSWGAVDPEPTGSSSWETGPASSEPAWEAARPDGAATWAPPTYDAAPQESWASESASQESWASEPASQESWASEPASQESWLSDAAPSAATAGWGDALAEPGWASAEPAAPDSSAWTTAGGAPLWRDEGAPVLWRDEPGETSSGDQPRAEDERLGEASPWGPSAGDTAVVDVDFEGLDAGWGRPPADAGPVVPLAAAGSQAARLAPRSLDSPHQDRQPRRRGTWRKALFRGGLGLLHGGGVPSEDERVAQLNQIRSPLHGCYRVAVISLKGGVGKTTTTAGLGATLASVRGDRVVAFDANPDAGTLGDRLRRQTDSTVRDLLLNADRIRSYSDLRSYVSQAPSRLEVLANDVDPAVSTALTAEDYRAVSEVLGQYYSVLITDSGTGLLFDAMKGILGMAHTLVVVSSASVDGARSASTTLDWLSAHGYDDLVSRSVAVISMVGRGVTSIDLDALSEHFASRVRAVTQVPYDPHLSTGGEVDLEELQPATRDAYVDLAALVAEGFESY